MSPLGIFRLGLAAMRLCVGRSLGEARWGVVAVRCGDGASTALSEAAGMEVGR